MESYRADIRFKQGRKLLQENKFEEAIEFFSSLLQSQITLHGEQTIAVAPLWFEYGRALLMKEQENPTDDLLGAVAEEAKKQAKALGEELNGGETVQDEEEEEQEEEEDAQEHQQETSRENSNQAGDEAGEEAGEEDASDMEIAWEALEVARKIFENEQNPEYDLQLSEVYESLGDIHRFNGNFSGAIEEYQRSVELREIACEDHDRLLAQAYYSLAVAHIYLSGDIPTDGGPSTLTPEAVLSLKKTALRYYSKAKDVLMKCPPPSQNSADVPLEEPSPPPPQTSPTESSQPSSSAKVPLTEAEERKELCDEITETITALEQEIQSLESPQNSSSSQSSSFIGASTTTIGFGQSSTSSSMPMLEVKRKTTSFPSSSSSSSSSPIEQNKKPRIEASSESSIVNGQGGGSHSGPQ